MKSLPEKIFYAPSIAIDLSLSIIFSLSRIVCPEVADPNWGASILNIMSKVRLEAMMWGAGTALGELPPYFMARAARLSGYDPDDKDDLREFEELQKKRQNPASMVISEFFSPFFQTKSSSHFFRYRIIWIVPN